MYVMTVYMVIYLMASLWIGGDMSECGCGGVNPPPKSNVTLGGEGRYIWLPNDYDDIVLVDTEAPVSEEELLESERAGDDNQYWLFTRRNRDHYQRLYNNTVSVRNSNYNSSLPLMVITHGYYQNGYCDCNMNIAHNYLDLVDANVIVLDWHKAATACYTKSVRNVPSVGAALGNFLKWLIDNAGGSWNNIHLVGFSLGAHVIGNAGRAAGNQCARLTALDPAGPLWHNNSNALNRGDAVYVEAIHTDGGWYGFFDPIANADFYPNGGRHRQPNCWVNTCSHRRVHELFTSSIKNSDRFAGRLCRTLEEVKNNRCTGNTLHMGNTILSKRGEGLYRLVTTGTPPFFES